MSGAPNIYDPGSLTDDQLAQAINSGSFESLLGAYSPAQLSANPNFSSTTSSDYQGAVNADTSGLEFNGTPIAQLGQSTASTLLGSGYANPGWSVNGAPISNAQQTSAWDTSFQGGPSAGLTGGLESVAGLALGVFGGAAAYGLAGGVAGTGLTATDATVAGAGASGSSGAIGGGFETALESGGGAAASSSPGIATAGVSGAGGLGSAGSTLSSLAGYGALAQGAAGLLGATYLKNTASSNQAAANPLAPYQAGYAAQLSNLVSNPSTLINTPGYQAGLQAVERGQSQQGQTANGASANALLQYGGNIYNQQVSQLAGLATQNAAPAAQIGQTGTTNAVQLAGQGLGSLAYGGILASQ